MHYQKKTQTQTPLLIRIPSELMDRLTAEAGRRTTNSRKVVTRTEIVREAVAKYLTGADTSDTMQPVAKSTTQP